MFAGKNTVTAVSASSRTFLAVGNRFYPGRIDTHSYTEGHVDMMSLHGNQRSRFQFDL